MLAFDNEVAEQVAKLAVELGKKATDRMMDRVGLDWQKVKFRTFASQSSVDSLHDRIKIEADIRPIRFWLLSSMQ